MKELKTMNLLTFDIEEWSIEKDLHGGRKEEYIEYDRLLDHILELLSIHNIKATFFCLGKIAVDFPHVIRKIDAGGHEIGSHSYSHRWVNKMTPDEFREDSRQAVYAIEDLIGRKVRSFRAPAFSIGESNKWAFEVMSEFGIENDASIFPGTRDFGGFPNFTEQNPCIIDFNGIKINEFPIPLYSLPILNKDIAYSGGGYFRLLPLWFVKKLMESSSYNMCYFHIKDLLSRKGNVMSRSEYEKYFKESGSLKNRYIRYFKSNVGRGRAIKNLDELVATFKFHSIFEYIERLPLTRVVKL